MSNVPAYLKGRGRGRGRGHDLKAPPGGPSKNKGPGNLSTYNGGRATRDLVVNDVQRNFKPVKDEAKAVVTNKSPEERFEEVSSKHQHSIRQHLGGRIQYPDQEESSEEEDEDDIGDNILTSVFDAYSTTFESGDSGEVNKAQEYLLHSFRSGSSACLICIETIKKTDAIWNCGGCFAMFHIQCIQKWVKEGVYQHIYKSEDDNVVTKDIPWHCPKCRTEYKSTECPRRYLCFCGKEEDPKFDPWLVPHSCGQKCERELKPQCGHHCLLLCHPGPCPPCPKTVKVNCHCGKSPPQVRRCSAKAWSCGQPCGQLLSCGQHKCTDPCHSDESSYKNQHLVMISSLYFVFVDECKPCSKKSNQPCHCGKAVTPCRKQLSCKSHVCEKVCHSGNCGTCPRSGTRTCPCGKTEFNLPCTEDIPTCGDTCGKMLDCGKHACLQRCHTGPCGNCRQMAVKTCRCGKKQKEVQCCKDYLCDIKCNNMRDCRKHQCKRKVQRAGPWEGRPQIREEIVKKPCPPCPVPMPMQCLGKHETGQFPCAELRPYSCGRKCGRQLACGNHTCNKDCHEVVGAENDIKSGENCEECEEGCLKPRPEGCTHPCPTLKCHPGDCPPCQQMIRMRCHCQLAVQHVNCSSWSDADSLVQASLKSCKGECPKNLPCGHQCGAICHPGICPNAGFCEKKVTLRCKCRRRKKEAICKEVPENHKKLECDEICKQEIDKKKKIEEEKNRQLKEEELKKQQAELEEFERKKGRKRRQRRQH
ncbi:hypothetical protein KUTeg_025012 [Tegillarca granosa]|uniref:Uncharacterized protein n=1 Tax=Tegillarca granosa TaxID=220873 RepID=A0ABQ9E418_TEGGR|nr:hypothetical protein KUTeg_025012 [Tegillarca granosa]